MVEAIISLKYHVAFLLTLAWVAAVGLPLFLYGPKSFAYGIAAICAPTAVGVGAFVVQSRKNLLLLLYRNVDELALDRIQAGLRVLGTIFLAGPFISLMLYLW